MAEEVVHQDRIMSQDTRMIAILLSFIGGSLDVYCHIRFDALLATQTGNIVLLIADLAPDNWHNTIVKLISMLLFSIGFLLRYLCQRSCAHSVLENMAYPSSSQCKYHPAFYSTGSLRMGDNSCVWNVPYDGCVYRKQN